MLIYLLFCFAIYSLWSLITPFNGSPDEYMRWDLLKYMTEHWALPHVDEPTIRNQLWGFSYASLPYISQILGALFFRIARYFALSPHALLYAARLPSVLFSVGTVFFTYKIGQKLFSEKAARLLTIMVSMWPEYAMIASYINNDSFALFTVSIITYSWICGIQSNWNWRSCILLAVGVGLCLLSYYIAFGFILLSAILWFWSVLSRQENREASKPFLKKAVFMLVIVIGIAGWWYIRNAYIYNGDFLGLNTRYALGEKYAIEELKPSNRNTYLNHGKSVVDMLRETPWVRITLKSFIAVFGYMNIEVNSKVYEFYAALVAIGIIGAAARAVKWICCRKKQDKLDTFYAFIILSIPIPVILSIIHSYSTDFQPQGRYFLQMFKDSDGVPERGLSAYSDSEMREFCDILRSYDIDVEIR